MEHRFHMVIPSGMARGAAPARRAASAKVARSLRDALATGRALTYAELASAAGCSERTVRNCLDDAAEVLGFAVERVRGTDHSMRARRAGAPSGAPKIEQLARALAGELLRNVFPIAGTDLEPSGFPASKLIVVSIRGAYAYGERHLKVLRQWLQLASSGPHLAARFRYDGADSGEGLRVVWPVGMVLRDVARVYLAGVPAEARDGRDVRTYALESVVFPPSGPALEALDARDSGTPPPRLAEATIAEAIDAPFSMFRPTPDRSVFVKVSFGPRDARYVRDRRWHRRQRLSPTPDGGVILEFGPADRDEVAAWLRTWGDGARVLELRRAKAKQKE